MTPRSPLLALTLTVWLAATGALAQDSGLIDSMRREAQVVWDTTLLPNQLAEPMAAAFE